MARPRKPSYRPEPEDAVAEVQLNDGSFESRRGYCLDSILRGVIVDIGERAEWTDAAAGASLGVPRTTLRGWLKDGATLSLENLSKICAALKITPTELFEFHEVYKPENRIGVTIADERAFEPFRRLLTKRQAARIIAIIKSASARGDLDEQISAFETLLPKRSRRSPAEATGTKRKNR